MVLKYSELLHRNAKKLLFSSGELHLALPKIRANHKQVCAVLEALYL